MAVIKINGAPYPSKYGEFSGLSTDDKPTDVGVNSLAWFGGRIVMTVQNANDEYHTGEYGAIKKITSYRYDNGDYYGLIEFEGCSLTTAVVSSMEALMNEYLVYAD